jgi:hypothetical protein
MQKAITDAYNTALAQQSSNNAVLSIQHAKTLGNLLVEHQIHLNKIINSISMVRQNAKNGLPIDPSDLTLFFHYYNQYKSHTIIHSKPIEIEIQKLLYFDNSNNGQYIDINGQYNQKNHIYSQIQKMSEEMNSIFHQ